MLSNLYRFYNELLLVQKILPLPLYIRWILGITKYLNVLIKTKSLGLLDKSLNESFSINFNGKNLYFNNLDFGVIREIYGHLCYTQISKLKDAKHILDLGANGGAFTIFALSEAPQAQVYAVEAQLEFVNIIKHNVKQNLYENRLEVKCAVVGGFYDDWTQSLLKSNPQIQEFNIYEYIERVGTCDFLKCDVEGGEFHLFQGDLSWTQAVKSMALEYHPNKGDVDELEKILQSQGFIVKRADHKNLGYFYCTRE
ncbi:FkbM family methyltransferase [Nostoc commune]|uniref:FkbM family methyltransferase n=1 Tax=Nostoc commune TaxID=1178 RepID=UPI0018C490BC|nr:FkbM family methyltransferase [Nostoc commune]MBG1260308.1 FkbM family methyltransferase [Nostoc commune BAE]